MAISERRMASNHARRINTMIAKLEALAAEWDDVDNGVRLEFEQLAESGFKAVLGELDYVLKEKGQEGQ